MTDEAPCRKWTLGLPESTVIFRYQSIQKPSPFYTGFFSNYAIKNFQKNLNFSMIHGNLTICGVKEDEDCCNSFNGLNDCMVVP
jgi:hypothetical protein